MDKKDDANYSLMIGMLVDILKAYIQKKEGEADETDEGGNLCPSVNK